MNLAHYGRIWLTSARYSIMRMLMFRGDFLVWSLVELFWMTVNLLMISVIYRHTDSVAGWSKYEMMLLVSTSLLIQRFLMGFFWSSIFEMGRNIRSGNFDFFLAQPGNIMFMATTRKLDPDSLVNSVVATGVVIYAARQLGLDVHMCRRGEETSLAAEQLGVTLREVEDFVSRSGRPAGPPWTQEHRRAYAAGIAVLAAHAHRRLEIARP